MRSSVVTPYPSSGSETPRQPYDSRPDPHESHEPHIPVARQQRQYYPQSKIQHHRSRRLVLAPEEGWLPMVLLAIAVCSVVFSISSAGWVTATFTLPWCAAVGLLVGLIVAKLRFVPQLILHPGACLIGHWLSVWLTSAVALHIPMNVLLTQIGTLFTDPSGLADDGSRMVFLFYLSFLCFFLGYFGAWLIYRAHLPWLVALVYCSILLVNLNYAKYDGSYLLIILLAALIPLIARIHLSAQLAEWKFEGLHTDRSWLRGITWRFMQAAAITALLALLVTNILPGFGQPQPGTTFWNSLNNVMTNLSHGHVSLQNPGAIIQPYQTPANFFSNQLSITGSVNLPTGNVLEYTSSDGPQYLEGFTYDRFDGHMWTSTAFSSSYNFNQNNSLPLEIVTSSKTVQVVVNILIPPDDALHHIFAPAQPENFDVPTTLYGNFGSGAAINTISAWTQQGPLTRNEHYHAVSIISTATAQDLAAVPFPQDNPDIWSSGQNNQLLTAYTRTPADLSPDVLKTLRQWTQGTNSPYAALKMLEAHLNDRTTFTYSTDNSPIPSNVDAVDWLLKTHRGYCTYYASAMTIMARLLGIPTRMVSGFSQGTFDAKRKLWVVQGSDAHSWVQVYFPSYGWINFDPTPGYAFTTPVSQQPTAPTPVPTHTPKKPTTQHTPSPTRRATPPQHLSDPSVQNASAVNADAGLMIFVYLSIGAVIFSLLFLFFAIMVRWWRRLYADTSFIAGTYWKLCHVASLVGFAPHASQTPYEYSSMLSHHVAEEAAPLWKLTELFVRERWADPAHRSGEEAKTGLPSFRKIVLGLVWMKARKRRA